MNNFNGYVEDCQTSWRRTAPINQEHGWQNGKSYSWILPREYWEQGLWPGIRSDSSNSLPAYLSKNNIHRHDGSHNLKSSWMLCANLYFPFRRDTALLANFLKDKVLSSVKTVNSVELEYAAPSPLDPSTLLGEPHGQRGKNQTSPDVAFIVSLNDGSEGLILTENKFTEHSFYACSGRDKTYENPDISRCMNFKLVMSNIKTNCYQTHWEHGDRTNRKYWDYLQFTDRAHVSLRRCPAANAGYQLFRQQALAEAIAKNGPYSKVVSCVAYDDRNDTLLSCLRSTGVQDFTQDWSPLFQGKAGFASFTHQQWVNWVRHNDHTGSWTEWVKYIEDRYKL